MCDGTDDVRIGGGGGAWLVVVGGVRNEIGRPGMTKEEEEVFVLPRPWERDETGTSLNPLIVLCIFKEAGVIESLFGRVLPGAGLFIEREELEPNLDKGE